MIERTSDFLSLVGAPRPRSEPAASPRAKSSPKVQFNVMVASIQSRLRKAASLHRDIAASYADFSALGMTDDERDRVDDALVEALEQCEDNIKALSDVADAPGDAGKHRLNVSLLLFDALKDAQQRVNAMRVLRQGHAMSAKPKLCPVVADAPEPHIVPEEPPAELSALSPEELLELEQENKQLESALITEFEEIRHIERASHQVSNLLSLFSEKLMEQHDTISGLYDDAQKTVDVVNQVPEELQRATEHSAGYRRSMLTLFVGMGFFLLAWEWTY